MIQIIHEAEHEYHTKAKHYLSSHQLADFRKCPELFRRKRSGLIPDAESNAYLIGRAAHCLILEGRAEFDDIHFYENDNDELYDLSRDKSETTDLAITHTDHVKIMRNKLLTYLKEVGARFPVINTEFKQ